MMTDIKTKSIFFITALQKDKTERRKREKYVGLVKPLVTLVCCSTPNLNTLGKKINY